MKKETKKILYIIFTILIVVSGISLYIQSNKQDEEDELLQAMPSEIEIDESKAEEVVVESFKIKMAPDVDLDAERKKHNNPDIVGRLEVPGLLNVLVVNGRDDKYYLNISIDGKKDPRGTEFLDSRVTPTSKQINIYGHNTRDNRIKVAFIKLEKFLEKSYFDENQYIIFQYDGGKSIYKIKAIKEIYEANIEHRYVDKTGIDFVNHVNAMTTGEGTVNSRDITVDTNSEIIVLQTCSHHWDSALYIITGVKIDYNNKISN